MHGVVSRTGRAGAGWTPEAWGHVWWMGSTTDAATVPPAPVTGAGSEQWEEDRNMVIWRKNQISKLPTL
jgi:hypothetical protein